jgi:hypothetical protein
MNNKKRNNKTQMKVMTLTLMTTKWITWMRSFTKSQSVKLKIHVKDLSKKNVNQEIRRINPKSLKTIQMLKMIKVINKILRQIRFKNFQKLLLNK